MKHWIIVLLAASALSGSTVWLDSESPFVREGGGSWGGGGGGGHGSRPSGITWWLYGGDSLTQSHCLRAARGSVAVFDNDMQPVEATLESKRGCVSVKTKTDAPGRYTVYYTQERDGSVMTTKLDAVRGRHGDRVELRGTQTPKMPFEIVRLPKEDEEMFSRYYSGDELRFRVLYKGKPLSGATLTLETSEGWMKRVVSDAEGLASFTLIKEYFPPWSLFDKRHKDGYLVRASYELAEPATHYVMSYPGSFYPAPSAYRSYAFALALGTAALVLSGIFVYVYRRRRVRVFEEVVFDEKA